LIGQLRPLNNPSHVNRHGCASFTPGRPFRSTRDGHSAHLSYRDRRLCDRRLASFLRMASRPEDPIKSIRPPPRNGN
jgi:hypothetical protein